LPTFANVKFSLKDYLTVSDCQARESLPKGKAQYV
jgi:hypothetical protein